MSKCFCARHYHCCVRHGIAYLKTRKPGVQCGVCLKVEQMLKKRELGKAMQELLLISITVADIIVEAAKSQNDEGSVNAQ